VQQQSIGTGYTRRRGQLEQDVREKVTRRMWGDGRDGCLVAGNERKELTVKSPTSETRSTLRLPAAFTSATLGCEQSDPGANRNQERRYRPLVWFPDQILTDAVVYCSRGCRDVECQ